MISIISAETVYQQVRIYYTDISDLDKITVIGIPLDHVLIKKGVFVELAATEDQVGKLINEGFQVEIIQKNLTRFYQERFQLAVKRHRGFELGSMGGNYTFDEFVSELDSLHGLYPTLVSEKMSIGLSYEGRDIWAVKVSDNVDLDENQGGDIEPLVLYTGVTHAREPLGMMNLIYFIYFLCENYGNDDWATDIIENRELWFIPVINPDGYVYNESNHPGGGGMHRKNRRPVCTQGNQGVDLNRNYSYDWGLNKQGSSPDSCSDLYRGEGPFSEPETSVIRDFIESKNFKNVLHYHVYSNLLIHSFGMGEYPPEPDLSMLREFGAEMTKFNHYLVGTGIETVGYYVNGDAVDWSYGDQGLVSYTPEIGRFSDGFWPSPDRIIPLCEENVRPNLYFAKIAGSLLKVVNVEVDQEFFNPGDTLSLSFDIQNIGLRNSLGSVIVTVMPMNNNLSIVQSVVELGVIESRQLVNFPSPFDIVVGSSVGEGCHSGIIIKITDGEYETFHDTVTFIIGEPVIAIQDDAESGMDNWTGGSWGLSDDAPQGDSSFTDSPTGNYDSYDSNPFEWADTIDLTLSAKPILSFSAKWDIEATWDFVQVQASTDGISWTSLKGKHTRPGSGRGVQPVGEPGYDGVQSQWVEEECDLSAFAGEPSVFVRFVVMSDNYTEGDGFYVDEIKILAFPDLELSEGDVNGDCILNIMDILLVVDFILSPETITEEESKSADMSYDGMVDVFDIVLMVQSIVGD
ncbi:MAG: immune inhibitor A [Candidatus Marinimicrobia bacterium]|nr:immune inhibitor A [Candidatus Neomarinimicrobiota bacterium]